MMLTWNTCEIRHNLSCSAEGPKQCGGKAKTRWIERGSASPNKQSFYPEPSGLLTLPVVGYLRSHRLLTLLLTGFETRIRPWLKSKSCVHNAQCAGGHYRTLGVIRSVPGCSPCWSACCLTVQTAAVKTMMVKHTLCFSLWCVIGPCDRISAQPAAKTVAVNVFVCCFWSDVSRDEESNLPSTTQSGTILTLCTPAWWYIDKMHLLIRLPIGLDSINEHRITKIVSRIVWSWRDCVGVWTAPLQMLQESLSSAVCTVQDYSHW